MELDRHFASPHTSGHYHLSDHCLVLRILLFIIRHATTQHVATCLDWHRPRPCLSLLWRYSHQRSCTTSSTPHGHFTFPHLQLRFALPHFLWLISLCTTCYLLLGVRSHLVIYTLHLVLFSIYLLFYTVASHARHSSTISVCPSVSAY